MPMFISVIGLLELQFSAFTYYHLVNEDSLPYEVLFLFLYHYYRYRLIVDNHCSELKHGKQVFMCTATMEVLFHSACGDYDGLSICRGPFAA